MHSSENALIILPRIRVQNVNCISAPLTWGFPSVTSFAGLMTALERRLGPEKGIRFKRFGVVCHDFQPLVNRGRFLTTFNLTRNPVGKDGETLGIVEEGRAHMEVSIVFAIQYDDSKYLDETREQGLANEVLQQVFAQRIAGGSVRPPGGESRHNARPKLLRLASLNWEKEWRRAKLNLLPGFTLVMRNDLLGTESDDDSPDDSREMLHRFIRLGGRTFRSTVAPDALVTPLQASGESKADWAIEPRNGWLVPIPIGYSALGELHPPGRVANARDRTVPFRFVESIYSIGQWISPHRIRGHDEMLWQVEKPTASGLYLCRNRYPKPAQSSAN